MQNISYITQFYYFYILALLCCNYAFVIIIGTHKIMELIYFNLLHLFYRVKRSSSQDLHIMNFTKFIVSIYFYNNLSLLTALAANLQYNVCTFACCNKQKLLYVFFMIPIIRIFLFGLFSNINLSQSVFITAIIRVSGLSNLFLHILDR